MSVWLRMLTAALCVFALGRHAYGYYSVLRWVTCVTAAYCAAMAHRQGKTGWVWALGTVAVLFNPLVPVYLKRDLWAVIDVATAVLMVVSLGTLREDEAPPPPN